MSDFEEWDEDPPPEAMSGAAFAASGDSELGALLLSVTGDLARLLVLLYEADGAAWEEWGGRIEAVRAFARALPATGPSARRVGFR